MNETRVERIINSGQQAVFVLTGGGSTALNDLLTNPGASRFVLDARIPYSSEALGKVLGHHPAHAVSPDTVQDLAEMAFVFLDPGSEIVSIACSAALATDRERRGADRAFICIKTLASEKMYSLCFSESNREDQEKLLSEWMLVLIAHEVDAERILILPGSFDPVHQGHLDLLKSAEEMTGLRGIFELSDVNVDKELIWEDEVYERAAKILDIPVVLTRVSRFTQKAEVFPNSTFVLGHDTAVRLIDYAQDGEWETFKRLGADFLVAGRVPQSPDAASKDFKTLDSLSVPEGFESLFQAIPEDQFRADTSSSEIREK